MRARSQRGYPQKIGELGPFELITKGDELPVFAFKLRDKVENYTVFDVSNALRERLAGSGLHVPEESGDLAALRVVVRAASPTTSPICS
jgi:glutamate decarboxylase